MLHGADRSGFFAFFFAPIRSEIRKSDPLRKFYWFFEGIRLRGEKNFFENLMCRQDLPRNAKAWRAWRIRGSTLKTVTNSKELGGKSRASSERALKGEKELKKTDPLALKSSETTRVSKDT